MTATSTNAQSAIEHCRKISTFSDEPGAITRTFLSPAMRECVDYLCSWARRIGMRGVCLDAAGNFRAHLPGISDKRLVIASHVDTVPSAGAFDGVLGVVLGMCIAESFHSAKPSCALEIVGFSEEEGVRFSRPFIGSTAYIDGLNEEFLQLADESGVSVAQAIRNFGLNPEAASKPQMEGEGAAAYLEFHIEQGPVLESLGIPLGIVDAIVGQSRATVEFVGRANHAGTTPMNLRQDAFCAAAEWTLRVESMALSQPGLVATVGMVKVAPGAVNIVPERVSLSLDLRHAIDEQRLRSLDELLHEGNQIAIRRNLSFHSKLKLQQAAVPMQPALVSQAAAAVAAIGLKPHYMTSGAGHDAMVVARRMPAAMIFLRSPAGVSHHPDENVLVEDVALALKAGRKFVENFV